MDRIEDLIDIYTTTAKNLRRVADLAEAQGNESVASTSRAKALVYEGVINDLKAVQLGEGKT